MSDHLFFRPGAARARLPSPLPFLLIHFRNIPQLIDSYEFFCLLSGTQSTVTRETHLRWAPTVVMSQVNNITDGNLGMLQEALRTDVHPRSDHHHRPSTQQREWLRRGLGQPGGKLPLFDKWGQRISERTVRSCIEQGWAEPWFTNPLKPDWLVCKLTSEGRSAVQAD